jgi:hypothetical protein
MTPLQAAKAHCANYQQDGSCLGFYYNDDLSVDWSRDRPVAKMRDSFMLGVSLLRGDRVTSGG